MSETKSIQDLFNDNIDVPVQWLDVCEYEFKMLMLTSILATQNLAYRGTLKTMCEWLGIKSSTNNNSNIKIALESLQSQGYIFYKVDGRTYTITISNKGLNDKQIVRLRKLWIEAFKHYNKDDNNKKINKNISIDWIQIARVFIFLYQKKETPDSNIITADKISKKFESRYKKEQAKKVGR